MIRIKSEPMEFEDKSKHTNYTITLESPIGKKYLYRFTVARKYDRLADYGICRLLEEAVNKLIKNALSDAADSIKC